MRTGAVEPQAPFTRHRWVSAFLKCRHCKSTTIASCLLRWARYVTVRAEHTAVPRLRPQHRTTRRAIPEELARIHGHVHPCCRPALGAGHRAFQCGCPSRRIQPCVGHIRYLAVATRLAAAGHPCWRPIHHVIVGSSATIAIHSKFGRCRFAYFPRMGSMAQHASRAPTAAIPLIQFQPPDPSGRTPTPNSSDAKAANRNQGPV